MPNRNNFGASQGTIHIRNGAAVFVSKIDGSETPGFLDKNGDFHPSNNPKNANNRSNNNGNLGLSDNDFAYAKIQYKQLCNGDCQDIMLALETKDPRVLAAACTASAEYDLDVNEKMFDLLGDKNAVVSQSARHALLIKSFYLLNKIKAENGDKKAFNLKPSPKNLEKYCNSNNLEIGIDYVDFGPMVNDNNIAVNTSVLRWRAWMKRNESKLSGMKKKGANKSSK